MNHPDLDTLAAELQAIALRIPKALAASTLADLQSLRAEVAALETELATVKAELAVERLRNHPGHNLFKDRPEDDHLAALDRELSGEPDDDDLHCTACDRLLGNGSGYHVDREGNWFCPSCMRAGAVKAVLDPRD